MAQSNKSRSIMRFTGLGFQMLACILICVMAGHYADKHFGLSNNLITALLGLVGVLAAIYLIIREVSRNPGKG